MTKATDSPRYCRICDGYGDHHTDRHTEMAAGSPVVTRSVEIPEAAVDAVWDVLTAAHSEIDRLPRSEFDISIPAALAAALPYLTPAGDGGLREALEQTAREKIAEWYGAEWSASEDKFYETYDGGGISCVDDEAMLELRGVRLALDLALVAQPAAPAVMPVIDREAVARPDEHFYGEDRAMADEMECAVCGYPTRSDGCGHETDAHPAVPAVPQPADDLERLHLAASALADLWHVPIDVFWQTREMHLEILRSAAVPQPVDREASVTLLDCGICYRDDSDPEKIVITHLAECGNHGRY